MLAAVEKIDSCALFVKDIRPSASAAIHAPFHHLLTLQQEASRKLGFSASRTMQVAQKLYTY